MKKPLLYSGFFILRIIILFLVEMRRIELLSESTATQLSPSAVHILNSKTVAYRQATIFISR